MSMVIPNITIIVVDVVDFGIEQEGIRGMFYNNGECFGNFVELSHR